jgi:transcriptional regulator
MSLFERYALADVADLIAEYPLAWVTAADGKAQHAGLLPLLGRYDVSGQLVRLIGHVPRNFPLAAALKADPRALILFQGPQGYVSPAMAGSRTWIPTWNFAQVRIEARLEFLDDGADAALAALVETMEAGADAPWLIAEAGERYDQLKPRIVAFDATPMNIVGRFKLGQDETVETLRRIIANTADDALARWTRRMNAARLQA